MTADLLADTLLVASRFVWYAGGVGVIGVVCFRFLVAGAGTRPRSGIDRELARAGVLAGVVLVSGIAARLYAQTHASFGLEESVTASLLLEVATALPPWSTGWLLQLSAALLALVALAFARTGGAAGWYLGVGGALAIAGTAPLTGHAVAQEHWFALPILLQAAHVLGAGIWIGGLSTLLAVGLRPRREPAVGSPGAPAAVEAFSRVALSGAGLLVLTGALTTALYLHNLSDLWTSRYGRTLLLKVTVVAAVALLGLVNWRYVRPRLAAAGQLQRLRRVATIELVLAVVVLALTATLVGLPQPEP